MRAFGPDVVVNAALTTGLGMFALAAIVYATGLDLRRFQGIFMIALLGLIVVGIISIFVRFIHPETYAWITLAIFSGLVLIDFARLRAGGDGLTPVLMATQHLPRRDQHLPRFAADLRRKAGERLDARLGIRACLL